MYHISERSEETDYQDPRNSSLHLPELPDPYSPPLCRHILFQLSVRLIIYCLLVQSILPSFAWAAAIVEAPSLEASSLSSSSSLLYLPHIYQEAEVQEERQPSRAIQKSLPFHAIDTSSQATIEASISYLKKTYGDLYKDLKYVAESVEWLNYGLVFNYLPAKNELTIAGGEVSYASARLRIEGPGKIFLRDGVRLKALEAPEANIENKSQTISIKTLVSKTFTQKQGRALITSSLTCHQNLENKGAIASLKKLHLVVNGKTTNRGAIKADTLTGTLGTLHNYGAVQAGFKNLTIESLYNHGIGEQRGLIEGSGMIRIGKGSNKGTIKSSSLTLNLYQDEFLNEGMIVSTQAFKTVGKGVLREGKGSQIITPHWHINNRVYEKENKNESHKYDKVTVGKAVQRWVNHQGSTLSARTLEFFASKQVTEGSLRNGGTFLVDHFINHAAHFQNAGGMHLGVWEQRGEYFHNQANATLDVRGNAVFAMKTLLNNGDITVHGTASGKITHLINSGGLTVDGNFRVQGNSLTNERNIHIKGIAHWYGRTLTNSGIMRLGWCDIATWYQFINSGFFLWTHYLLRAAHIINLGWMEKTQDLTQPLKLDYAVAKAKLARDFEYQHFTVENHGVLKLQTTYKPKRAAHQKTNVRFKHWKNSGSFFDHSRHLKAESFTNTGSYQTQGALTGSVDHFSSSGKLDAGRIDLTSKVKVNLSGELESKGTVVFNTTQFSDSGLRMKAKALDLTSATPLTLTGTYDVTKLNLAFPNLTVTGRVIQQEEEGKRFSYGSGTSYEGYSLTVEPSGTFMVDNFRIHNQASVFNKGKFAAYWALNTHLQTFMHLSSHPLVMSGCMPTIDYFYNGYASSTQFYYGSYTIGKFTNRNICEVLGSLTIADFEKSLPIRLGHVASVKIDAGHPGVIEAQGPVKLLLKGAENKEDDFQGAQVICLADEMPTLRTQHKASLYFGPHYNLENFVREHLASQEYNEQMPLLLQGDFFRSTTDFEVLKALHLVVDKFDNIHHVKLGPSTIYARSFHNGTPLQQTRSAGLLGRRSQQEAAQQPLQMGQLEFLGKAHITSQGDLNNTRGRIIAKPIMDAEGKVRSPGELTLISEGGSLQIGVPWGNNGSLVAAKDKLALKSLQAHIKFYYVDVETHASLEIFAPQGIVATITSYLRAVGAISVTLRHLDHSGGLSGVRFQNGWTSRTQMVTPGYKQINLGGHTLREGTESYALFLAFGRSEEWVPPKYETVNDVPTYDYRPNSPGSEFLSQENKICFIFTGTRGRSSRGVCRGSKILAAQDIIKRSADGGLPPNIDVIKNYNESSECQGHRLDIDASRFNFDGGYMAASTVKLVAFALELFGGSGARAGVGQRQTYGLRAFFLNLQRSSRFYEVDPASNAIISPLESLRDVLAPWPVELSVAPAASSTSLVPAASAPPRVRRADLSLHQATQGFLRLEMYHFGYVDGLSPEEMLLQGAHNAHALEERFGALTAAALQSAQESLVYVDNGGALRITLPPAQNTRLANIAGRDITKHARDRFVMGRGLQVVGEEDVKGTSDGTMTILRDIITEEHIEEDGTRVTTQRAEPAVDIYSLKTSVMELSHDAFSAAAPKVQAAQDVSLGSTHASARLDPLVLTQTRVGPEVVSIEHREDSDWFGLVDKSSTIVTKSQSVASSQSAVGADISGGGEVNLHSGVSSTFTSGGGKFRARKIKPQGGQAHFKAVPLESRQEVVTDRREQTESSFLGLIPLGSSRNVSSSSSQVTVTDFSPDVISGGEFNPTSTTTTLEGTQVDVDHIEDDSHLLELLPARGVNSSSVTSEHTRQSAWRGEESASSSRVVKQDVILPTSLKAKTARFGREGQGDRVITESAIVNIGENSEVYASVIERVATVTTQVSESSQQEGLHPVHLPQVPLFASDSSSALNAGSQVLESATQVGGMVNRALAVATGQTPWWQALLEEFGSISTTSGTSRRSVLTSSEAPNDFNWGHATFHGGELELQGRNVFRTLNGSVSRLTVRPIANSNRVTAESYQEQASFNPFSLSVSSSQLSSRHWESEDRFTSSLMQVTEGGDFTVLNNVNASGLDADVHNFRMSVQGDMHISSPIDVVSSRTEQRSSGFSVNALALATGLAAGDPIQIAMSGSVSYGYDLQEEKHRFVGARSQFGGSGSSLRVNGHLTQVDTAIDERVSVYSVSRTVSSTPEEHYSNHERSLIGQALRFAYALHGAYSMATTLRANLNRLAAPAAPERAQPTERGRAQEAAPEQKEEQPQPLSSEDRQIADDIVADLEARAEELGEERTSGRPRGSSSSSLVPSGRRPSIDNGTITRVIDERTAYWRGQGFNNREAQDMACSDVAQAMTAYNRSGSAPQHQEGKDGPRLRSLVYHEGKDRPQYREVAWPLLLAGAGAEVTAGSGAAIGVGAAAGATAEVGLFAGAMPLLGRLFGAAAALLRNAPDAPPQLTSGDDSRLSGAQGGGSAQPPAGEDNRPSEGVRSAAESIEGTAQRARSMEEAVERASASDKINGNSKNYVGETHVYSIYNRTLKQNHKVGQSMQGVNKLGQSKRAEEQVRKLQQQTGMKFESRIRKTYPSKAPALARETATIKKTRRLFGSDALPGNKGVH